MNLFRVFCGLSLLTLLGCRARFDCSVEVDDTVGTVATVHWTSADLATTSVSYWVNDGEILTTPEHQDAREHAHVLYGMPGNSTVEFRAVQESDGRVQTCEGAYETDPIPGDIPKYEVTVNQTDSDDPPFVAIANAGNERAEPVVVNRSGQVVWWSKRSDEVVVTQFDVGADGIWLLEQDVHREDPERSALVRLDWLGDSESRFAVDGAHHRFVSLEDGTIAVLAVDIRSWKDEETGDVLEVVGDQIIEMDPDGTQSVVFSTWDVLEFNGEGQGNFYGAKVDWTHANGIWANPENDTYLVTLGHLDTVLEIDRASGALLKKIDATQYAFSEQSVPISFPHDAKWTEDDTLLLMTTDVFSFGVEYALDEQAGTVTELRRIGDDVEVYAAAMGEVQRLDTGGHLLCFGMGGLVQERDASDDVRWELWGRPGLDRLGTVRPFASF